MIKIDNNSSKAIYEQIYDEIIRLILSKVLKPDEQLPSVREMAAMTKINPNTIQKAYRFLELDNYIYSVKGVGNFVKNADDLRRIQIKKMKEQLIEVIKSLKELGLHNEEILEMIKETLISNND